MTMNISLDFSSSLAGFFQLLGQPVRIQILLIIAREQACVCHIEAVIGIRQAPANLIEALKLVASGGRESPGNLVGHTTDAATATDPLIVPMDSSARGVFRALSQEMTTRLREARVVSPIDGVVTLREVNVGDLASDAAAAKPIFRIVDNRLLNLTVTVPSADAARVKVGQPLEFSVDPFPGRTFKGRVMYVNPELSAADRSLKVIAEVKNVPEELKGGLFAKGRIVAGKRTNVLQLPRQALSGWEPATKKGSVFVVEGEMARLRWVETGTVAGDLVEVVAGLKAGERYVTRGGFNLKDGDRVATQNSTSPGSKR